MSVMDVMLVIVCVVMCVCGIGVWNVVWLGVFVCVYCVMCCVWCDVMVRVLECVDDECIVGFDSLCMWVWMVVDVVNVVFGTGFAARSRESVAGWWCLSEFVCVEVNDGVEYDVKLIVIDVDGMLLDLK